MSLSKLKKSIDKLSIPFALIGNIALISVFSRKKEDGSYDTNKIQITPVWRVNGDYFRVIKKKIGQFSDDVGVSREKTEGQSPGSYKQDPLKKIPLKKILSKETVSPKEIIGDVSRKYRLNPEQNISYAWLKSKVIDTEDKTLCFWAKTYSFARLKDVYLWAMRKERKSIGAFINHILTKNAIVETDYARENKLLAVDFKADNKWGALEIHEHFMRSKNSRGKEMEVSFDMKSDIFLARLLEMNTLC